MRWRDALLIGVFATVMSAVSRCGEEPAPPPPTPEAQDPPSARIALPRPSSSDPEIIIELDDVRTSGSGTAFAVEDGWWMTARHVVDGCERVLVLTNTERGVAALQVIASRRSDLALIQAPLSRDKLALAPSADGMKINDYALHVGFPQSRPGEAESQLLGRETLRIRGRYASRAPVLAWAELSRTPGLTGPLSGISGGPAFNREGNVVGVTVAESPRRGRIYTTAPVSAALLMTRAGMPLAAPQNASTSAPGADADDRDAGRLKGVGMVTSDLLAGQVRRRLQVARVVCINP